MCIRDRRGPDGGDRKVHGCTARSVGARTRTIDIDGLGRPGSNDDRTHLEPTPASVGGSSYDRSTSLGARGSWLAHPHPLVMDSLGLVTRPVHAYDLGAGVGRHTLPIVAGLPAGSRVTAVDLIPSALASLVENAAAAGLSNRIETVSADLESWTFPADDAGLIVAFSALEHVSSLDAFCVVLERCRAATIPGGVNVIGIVADREEVSSSGARRAALIELPLSGEQA